jgi:hypothetical protein
VPLDSLLAAVDTHVAGKSEVKEKKKLWQKVLEHETSLLLLNQFIWGLFGK